jgi:hypothetical protein
MKSLMGKVAQGMEGSQGDKSEGGNGGVMKAEKDIIAQFQTTRIRSMIGYNMGGYKRIFQLATDCALTLDPSNFTVTNTFSYGDILKISPDPSDVDQFILDIDKTSYVYKTAFRSQLLCQFYECITKKHPNKFKSVGPFSAQRLRKNGSRVDNSLLITPYGIVETDPAGRTLMEYSYVNISRIGSDEQARAIFFVASGRTKVFFANDMQNISNGVRVMLQQVGLLNKVAFMNNQNVNDIIKFRNQKYMDCGLALATFDVNKVTKRSMRPMPRQFHVTEDFIVEKDLSGFQFVSFHRITSIYSVVRNWTSPREFTIEYDDGTSRTYTCAQRDTLLAMVLDVAHALGNRRVIVTGEVSDNLRLMPRHAEEEYQVSIKDAFFGASSIESWFLSRLQKVCKPGGVMDRQAVEKACRELNANVACPGLSLASDPTAVKATISGVLKYLNDAVTEDMRVDNVDNSRFIVSMLQSLYRICASYAGYKAFVEVKEVDTRLLMIQLTQMGNDFINYWTLELITMLCNGPVEHRKPQQEFVNKHTLLNDKMLKSLVDLMSSKIDHQGNITNMDDYEEEDNEDIRMSGADAPVPGLDKVYSPQATPKVAANAGAYGHLPGGSHHASDVVQEYKDLAPPTKAGKNGTPNADSGDPTNWHPSALVIVTAAALLESVVTSRRDSSSPEMLNSLLDLLKGRCDVLINMLRSSSFLILENAAILMFVLLKNRPTIAPVLKEMALSEGLTIRHFYNAVFSPSSSQRFISRFLVATWMSGSQAENPGKGLLKRVLPSGLVEYLKMEPLTEEHRKNLDMMEDEFYSVQSGQGKPTPTTDGGNSSSRTAGRGADLQVRMRKRLAKALQESIVERTPTVTSVTSQADKERQIQERVRAASKTQLNEPEPPTSSGNWDMDKEDTIEDQKVASATAGAAGAIDRAAGVGGAKAGATGSTIATSKKARQGHTISVAPNDGPGSGKPENYRVMFHVLTQDHKMPDLIWNEQTRLELRTALETELKEYDREIRLRGATKVAWNYQQFTVLYPSLKDEMKVGAVYVRHFLEANDSFIVGLENPSHTVLFEKLFRRVLVNVGKSTFISTLCTRCLTRLYATCTDKIGTFDDMMLTVRMLEQAEDMELQHCLLDLLNTLSLVDLNLHQLLDYDFVDVIIKYASLAHLNPDQIGNVLARATNQTLLLKDATVSEKADLANTGVSSAFSGTSGMNSTFGEAGATTGEDEDSKVRKRTMWVPDDIACPKVWFVCPPGTIPPPAQFQKGPYRVSELLDELDSGALEHTWYAAPSTLESDDDVSFGVHVDTGRWKPITDYFQLRMQMLFPGKAVYSPAQVAFKALNMLYRLAAVHKSANSKGIAFYPIPTSKRIMSGPEHLAIFAQLLLCNNSDVVDIGASLIKGLVEYNPSANSKLYLTGVFFFASQYTGNNFVSLAKMFEATHMSQSFHDQAASVASKLPLSQRSVLGTILPSALINILVNYGHARFASIFTGEFDTPEVIWNASLRRHVVEMVQQHLAEFPGRLRQYNLSRYEYCPIPKIHFPDLDRELYVHEYYLRNLCDEVRFQNWPIAEPLDLLREAIERWRAEMKKGVVDNSVREAEQVLGLKEKFTNAELRKAYKSLARDYHPDKNPNGRDMFEKIHQAYELLSSIELKLIDTDMISVVLLIKTQNIIYRRYSTFVADQKYPAYPLLTSVLLIPPPDAGEDAQYLSGTDLDLIVHGTLLANLSVSISPLNAKEFVKAGAVPKLNELFTYALRVGNMEILVNVLKAFTAVLAFDSGREATVELCPSFSENIYKAIVLDKKCPLAAENAMESVARGSGNTDLQNHFVGAGILWLLMPMLLSYDATCSADYADESQRTIHNQKAANMHAIVAAKALGRMGGYMFEDLASPENPYVRRALECLMTIPLAKLLRNRRPWDLLKALNENVECVTKIWNVGMRSELLDFVLSIIRNRPEGTRERDLEQALTFSFSAMRNELCVGGVYVRIYNKVEDSEDIDDPSQFCRDLLAYIWQYSKPSDTDELGERTCPSQEHRESAVEALKNLAVHNDYIAADIARAANGIDNVYNLLSLPSTSPAFSYTGLMFIQLCGNAEFVKASVHAEEPVVWRLLRALCEATGQAAVHVYSAAEAFASSPEGLEALLDCGSIAHLLGCLTGIAGHTSSFATRTAAIALLSKFLWNPVRGPDASHTLRRFLPEPIVKAMKNSAGSASLQVLDDKTENPELIWTAEMQVELREALTALFTQSNDDYSRAPEMAHDYHVPYQQLESELYVGGVYIRLYLKQPTFRLSNPVLFLEKLIEFWESAFNLQVPVTKAGASSNSSSASDDNGAAATAVVLGSEDFLSLLTSSIVCVVKGEPSVVDHLLAWGFITGLTDLMRRAMDQKKKGIPAISVVRLMSVFVTRVDCVDAIANTDIIKQIIIALGGTGLPREQQGDPAQRVRLPKEAGFIVELLKKIFQCRGSSFIGSIVHAGNQADVPNFLLDHVIGAQPDALAEVTHPAALRIHAVDTIKAIIAADEFQAGPLQAMLDVHPLWSEYRDQSHDLFITDQEKTDPFLIQDSTDKAVMGLLTDGNVKTGISTHFTSTGPPPPPNKGDIVVDRASTSGSGNGVAPPTPPSAGPGRGPGSSTSGAGRSSVSGPASAGVAAAAASAAASGMQRRATTAGAPTSASAAAVAPTTGRFVVTINKGAAGLGLDIGKIASGGCMIRRLKEMPGGVPNPAAACKVKLLGGDMIVGVNGQNIEEFGAIVAVIKSLPQECTVKLLIERGKESI